MDNYIILQGQKIATPFECLNWENSGGKVKRHVKVNPRERQCRVIVIHTVHGRTCRALKPGAKSSTRDLTWAKSHFNSPKLVSTDAYIDTDGSVAWCNDPMVSYTWGAGGINPVAMHFELVTDEDGQMYQATLDSAGILTEMCCRGAGIQMQTPWDFHVDNPFAGRIYRCDPGQAGVDVVGVLGHRNIWTRPKGQTRIVAARGFGDPNDFPFDHLVDKHGFEKFNYNPETPGGVPQDKAVWMDRQRSLGFTGADVDGVPLRGTVARLKEKWSDDGIWVPKKAA